MTGASLRKLRLALDITLADLARESGVTADTGARHRWHAGLAARPDGRPPNRKARPAAPCASNRAQRSTQRPAL